VEPLPKTGLALALELTDLGRRLQAQRFRREHPGSSEAEAEAHAQRWLFERPGAPHGDAEGVPGTWPRRPA
jgi:hypothetical protein